MVSLGETSRGTVESTDDIEKCLRGEKLYGDDFSAAEVETWFKDEREGYSNLGAKSRKSYVYAYHALNTMHGYSALPDKVFQHVLGVGSAYGDDLRPIVPMVSTITILEPSDTLQVDEIEGKPVHYVKPDPSGLLPFPDASFDLITCLSVLHHIPNVSTVFREICRCLAPGGYLLLREPIVSMGDWRSPRKGLTKRERGIPLAVLHKIIKGNGLQIIRERMCIFPITRRLKYLTRSPAFNSKALTYLDSLICQVPIWPRAYHPKNPLEKLRPNAIFLVLRKPVQGESIGD